MGFGVVLAVWWRRERVIPGREAMVRSELVPYLLSNSSLIQASRPSLGKACVFMCVWLVCVCVCVCWAYDEEASRNGKSQLLFIKLYTRHHSES